MASLIYSHHFTFHSNCLLTCLSCVSELTCTSHVSQWNVLFCKPVDATLGDSSLFFTPALGKDLMEPLPFRASSMVLCLVPGEQIQKEHHFFISHHLKEHTEESALKFLERYVMGQRLFSCTVILLAINSASE